MKNESGVIPVEFKCVVLPDLVEEKIGNIFLADTTKNRMKYQTVKATLIAAGGNAFCDWKEPIPKPGDRIYVAIAAGIVHEGPDKKEYRLVNDKDIAGILTEE